MAESWLNPNEKGFLHIAVVAALRSLTEITQSLKNRKGYDDEFLNPI